MKNHDFHRGKMVAVRCLLNKFNFLHKFKKLGGRSDQKLQFSIRKSGFAMEQKF